MWIKAGFSPGSFYEQTPRHFQLAMRGVRERLENEAQARTGQAYETGAFSGLAHHGKLKALKTYMRSPSRKMTHAEMLANMRAVAQRVNKKFGEE